MTNTRHGAPADAARVLRRSWPHLPWTDVRIARGAFHHVLLLPPRAVIRVRNGAEHARATDREVTIATTLSWAGLGSPGPLGDPVHRKRWSAAAYEFVEGAGFTARRWSEDRHVLLGLLEAWADAGRRVPGLAGSLPQSRAWCGGDAWPSLVDRLTAGQEALRSAARKRVRAMLDLEAEANGSLVHGDFGPHNIVLPASGGRAVLIDTDHASWADPAIDIAPLLASYPEHELAADIPRPLLSRATAHRRTLSLQVAAAAWLRGDHRLREHALGNFARRIRSADPQW